MVNVIGTFTFGAVDPGLNFQRRNVLVVAESN